MFHPNHRKWLTTLTGFSLLGLSSVTFGSGFQLFEYSGAAVGNYNAGGAAIAEDASTNYINPAGLVRLTAPEFVLGAVGIWSEATFKGQACGGALCRPANIHRDGGGYDTIPSFYYSLPINEQFFFGFGVSAPFGLATDYDRGNLLSYSATRSQVKTVNVNPSIAFKVNDKFSVGLGVSAQYMEADLNSSVNLSPRFFGDSQITNHADDWGFGWTVGGLYQFNEHTRAGLSYISQVHHDIEGTAKLEGGSLTHLKSNKLHSDITLPAMATASLFHEFNEHWSVMGTASYTQWDKVEDITLKNTTIPSGRGLGSMVGVVSLPENFRNTWRFAVGADYRINEQWKLRSGVGYDRTPVNDTDRTIRLPDSDRVALAAGIQYSPVKYVKLDAGYTHLFFKKDADINHITSVSKAIGHSDNEANLLGLQLTWDVV